MNQPLTFKSSIKSSGYTQAPRTTRFQPQTNRPRKPAESKFNPSATFSSGRPVGVRQYQAGGGPPRSLQHSLALGPGPTAVTSLQYATSGAALACSLMDGTAQLWRVAGPRGPSFTPLVGHNGPLEWVAWSHSGQWLVTASQDRSAIVWSRDTAEPVLKVTSLGDNLGSTPDGNTPQGGGEALKEVKRAQFFYLDRFLLLVAGGCLCLYKFHLDTTRDDVRRYLTRSRYKLVERWSTASQTLTAMAAVNSFYSHLVLTAGSNRSLSVFDLNAGRLAHEIPDAHPRAAHALAVSEGSGLALHSALAHNVFLSAAAADCVKLWDLRSRQCVQRYEGHVNKAQCCHLALSPCSQFLATGSEDRHVYVYDTRAASVCQRLKGHGDVVTSVAFNPATPQLASAGLDGKLLLFAPE